MLDAFISYSRRNLDFVEKLTADLEKLGKQIWFDKKKEPLSGIPAGSRWWDEIQHGIETADNFLIVISPESMESPYCHAEIAHALKHDKRIVTLLYCDNSTQAKTLQVINTAINDIPEDITLPSTVSADIQGVRSLARRNWLEISQIQFVVYADVRDWEQWLQTLVDAVDLDIEWVRQWGQFQQAVQIWVESEYDEVYRWLEPRLKPIRKMVSDKQQILGEDEQKFIEPEQKQLLQEIDNPNTTEVRRMQIGDRLGEIDDTREGLALIDGVPDLLCLPVVGTGKGILSNGVLEGILGRGVKYTFNDVGGSSFGSFVVSNFYISKYLITYKQYQAFVDDENGYKSRRWWKGFPDRYQPQYLSKQRTKSLNNPRDSISWYQSVAFGRWLNNKLRGSKIPHPALGKSFLTSDYTRNNKLVYKKVLVIGDNAQVRIPTEWEWQWVAQNGSQQRKYPWGERKEEHANTKESGLGRAIAVGMYPHGGTACGALDMSGQLYEWCANSRSNPEMIELTDSSSKVLRSGTFDSSLTDAGCANRLWFDPGLGAYNYGFRLVVSTPIAVFDC